MKETLVNNFTIEGPKEGFHASHEDERGHSQEVKITFNDEYMLDKEVITRYENGLTETISIYYKQVADAEGKDHNHTYNLGTASGTDKDLVINVLFSGDNKIKESRTGTYEKKPIIPNPN